LSVSVIQDEDKPWKTDLAQRSAQRRTVVAAEIEALVKKAPSFEEGLHQSVDLLKKRFARFSAITAYVADGEGLALHMSVERPAGPERIGSTEGPLGQAAQADKPTVAADVTGDEGWQKVGFSSGSVLVAPVRTDAGLWAILEIWSDFRDAFTPQDVKMLQTVTAALARKTPAA
jgi:putative methionine-R-sulfoxide reductase with GAF domain